MNHFIGWFLVASLIASTPVFGGATLRFDDWREKDGKLFADSGSRLLNIDPILQNQLTSYITERGDPIAATVVVDVHTGKVLAMAQGKSPQSWDAGVHTAIYAKFPAASVFKTIVAGTVLELAGTDPDEAMGLEGSCGDVSARGNWMRDHLLRGENGMNLRRAFGISCNSFFAKLAINLSGIGGILKFARAAGWEKPIPADFPTESSPIMFPPILSSNAQTVGRFAAGFGHVGLSAVHGAWIATAIANQGVGKPLLLYADSKPEDVMVSVGQEARVFSQNTTAALRDIMKATVTSGTARHAFSRGKYKRFMGLVGGKTGTLTGRTPHGLTTLFVGLYPIEEPIIAVSSIVVLEDRWLFKAPQLAAEAIVQYDTNIARQNAEAQGLIGKLPSPSKGQ